MGSFHCCWGIVTLVTVLTSFSSSWHFGVFWKKKVKWKSFLIRMACDVFSWLMLDVGGATPGPEVLACIRNHVQSCRENKPIFHGLRISNCLQELSLSSFSDSVRDRLWSLIVSWNKTFPSFSFGHDILLQQCKS